MTYRIACLVISRLESAITAYAQCQRSEITECGSWLRRERHRYERLRAALGTEVFEAVLADREPDMEPDRTAAKPARAKAKGRTGKRTEQGVLL